MRHYTSAVARLVVEASDPLDTWTSRNSSTAGDLFGITYGQGLFVAVGSGSTLFTSPDGETWTSRNSGTQEPLNGISYDQVTWVAVGDGRTGPGVIVISTDCLQWLSRDSGTGKNLRGIGGSDGLFVAVGNDGEPSQHCLWPGHLRGGGA